MAPTIRANYQFQEQAMNLDDFSMTDEQEEALKEKHEELIENQPEHEPNDGCDGGGCVI